MDPSDRKTIEDVAKHGWQCLHIPSDAEGPGFSFSVGFWETLRAPEVIVFGLDRSLMHNMLWEMFHQIRGGNNLADGVHWTNLIEGHDCISRPVHDSQISEYLGMAIWYLRYKTGRTDITAYQLFWPGKQDGLFPWDTGCNEAVREGQPALYLERRQ